MSCVSFGDRAVHTVERPLTIQASKWALPNIWKYCCEAALQNAESQQKIMESMTETEAGLYQKYGR